MDEQNTFELSGSASIPLAEIAEHAGLHANTVRTHMGELEASGRSSGSTGHPTGPGGRRCATGFARAGAFRAATTMA